MKLILNGAIVIIIVGLIIGCYYVFKNSAFGQLLAAMFGDLDGALNWIGNELKGCFQNGLTSSSCTLGPFIIGGAVLFAVLTLLSGLGVMDIFKSKLKQAAESAGVGDELAPERLRARLDAVEKAIEADPKLRQMSEEAKTGIKIQRSIKETAKDIDTRLQSSAPQANTAIQAEANKVQVDAFNNLPQDARDDIKEESPEDVPEGAEV